MVQQVGRGDGWLMRVGRKLHLAKTADTAPVGGDVHYQQNKRLATDVGLLTLNDIPDFVAIAANYDYLQVSGPVLFAINAVNNLSSFGSVASDLSVVRDCVTNKAVDRKTKAVDIAHFGTDLVNMGSGMIPTFHAVNTPLLGALFIGGQVIGTLADGLKLWWDRRHHFAQSGHEDGDQPHRLVMDRFEKHMGRLPMAMALVGAESLVYPSATYAVSNAVASNLVGFGGAFGAVYGATQVRKSRQLRRMLKDMQTDGIEQFDMPKWTRHGLQQQTIKVSEALKATRRRELGGWGQLGASTVLMLAGCLQMPALAAAGLIASAAVGVSALGAEAYAHRTEIAARLKSLVKD